MAHLIRMPRAAWRRQPQGAVEVNWADLLTAQLHYAVFNNYEAVSRTTPGLTPVSVGRYGKTTRGVLYYRAACDVRDVSLVSHMRVTSDNSDYAGLVWGFYASSSDSSQIGVGIGQLAGSGSPDVYGVNRDNGVSAPMLEQDLSLPYEAIWGVVGTIGDGGGDVLCYKNGQYIASVGKSGYGSWGVNSSRKLEQFIPTSTGKESAFLFKWGRRLSAFEQYEIYQNPWQLFKPRPARFILIPSSGGVITLIVQDAGHSHSVEVPSLVQSHVLALADSLHGHTVDSPILSQAYALTLAAAAHAHNADNLELSQSTDLAVAESSHAHSADNITLFQAHVLNLADALHGHSADGLTLTTAGSLIVADTSHSQSVDSPSLTQASTIAVADSAHGQSVDALTLTQAHILALADSTHAHSTEAPTLSTGLSLSPADTAHSQSVDSPAVIQAHILSLSDATHGHSADAVSMGQGYSLTVAEADHGHSVETPTVSVAFILAIQDALHAQAADALALATHVTLIVSDALHAHLAGSASEIILPIGNRIFLVANEDRLFLVTNEDRLFGV